MNERILDETKKPRSRMSSRGELLLRLSLQRWASMSRQKRYPTCRYSFFACHPLDQRLSTQTGVGVRLSMRLCRATNVERTHEYAVLG